MEKPTNKESQDQFKLFNKDADGVCHHPPDTCYELSLSKWDTRKVGGFFLPCKYYVWDSCSCLILHITQLLNEAVQI